MPPTPRRALIKSSISRAVFCWRRERPRHRSESNSIAPPAGSSSRCRGTTRSSFGWLQGYYLDEDAEPVVDVEKVIADLLRLTEHCKLRLHEELMAAAEELFGKQGLAPSRADSPAPPR